jgi:hypothetical protein
MRNSRRNEMLYADFVGVTNENDAPLPMSSDIALRDARNVDYAPTPLAPQGYAYSPAILEGQGASARETAPLRRRPRRVGYGVE